MEISIKIENLERVRNAFGRAPARIGKAIADGLQKSAFAVEREAKLSATQLIYARPIGPSGYIRTGLLRNRIETLPISSKLYAVVRSSVNYAHTVHEGLGSSRRYGRRPYMEIGAQRARIGSVFNAEIGTAIRNL